MKAVETSEVQPQKELTPDQTHEKQNHSSLKGYTTHESTDSWEHMNSQSLFQTANIVKVC